MAASFVSEPLIPVESGFDANKMAGGEPGLPRAFRWRKREIVIAGVLETWKEYGDCTHGSGERYVRKHGYCVKTTDGMVLKIYFQRKYGRVQRKYASRWWLFSMEAASAAPSLTARS